MAYQTGQVHLHSRIALPVRGLKKTSFDLMHENDYLVTTVGKLIFNSMFPEDFPYLNEVSKENFEKHRINTLYSKEWMLRNTSQI